MRGACVRTTVLLALTLVGGVAFVPRAHAQAVPGFCAAPYKINWPTLNPVWSLCWTPPDQSSGISGSGLELRHVFYRGRRVFWQAHVPVLNVQYDPGGCGGATLSYRDWQNELRAFEANNVLQPGYAEPTTPPRTVMDHPGSDAGTFAGVAVEKRADRLVITTQMQAGWYRYVQTWTFMLDGTIEPRFGFSAITSPCTPRPHNHHVYWRFDFDIEGAASDVIERFNLLAALLGGPSVWAPVGPTTRPGAETSDDRTHLLGLVWRVRDKTTGRGYAVIAGSADGTADAWAVADTWGLQYHVTELDDGGATGGPTGNAAHMTNFINGESVDGTDVVVWYHAAHRHAGILDSQFVGPTLKPLGAW